MGTLTSNIVLIVVGLFLFGGAAMDLDILMDRGKARRYVGWFGRTPMRILYILTGLAFLAIAAVRLAGMVPG